MLRADVLRARPSRGRGAPRARRGVWDRSQVKCADGGRSSPVESPARTAGDYVVNMIFEKMLFMMEIKFFDRFLIFLGRFRAKP